ncbi:ATP-binding protein [Amycolatopsis sp. NPDC101161]|uniref:ATP-binding protein n=1 Tax=Amycolatopsis sp. NPDC101161 TaxID=3363940 RepID=UPI0037FD34D4
MPERLVGRDAVLTIARAALEDALAGTAQLVLVTGEPGIGKTAVLTAFAAEAAGRGATVLRANCWDGGAPAYWPWVQALRGVPPGELGPAAELLGSAPERPAGSGAEAADTRFRLFDATAGLLTRLGREAGLVVVLDDLQWADAASLRMLEFLARHLGPARVLLLGAYRELAGGLPAAAQVVPLRGLDADEVAAVMTAVAGPRPEAGLADRVWRRSGGNPLFVRELTRLLQAGPDTADAVPETVRDILLSRLARLSQPCAELLAVAAVCGRTVRPELLGRLADVAPGLLEEATAARVLTRTADGLRFSHDLYRETLLDGLPAAHRAALHAAAGHALEELREAGAAVPMSEVAAQFVAAGPDAAADAVRCCALAGREAALRAAHADAAARYRDALAALDLLPGAAPGLRGAGVADRGGSMVADVASDAARAGGRSGFAVADAASGAPLGRRGGGADVADRGEAMMADVGPGAPPGRRGGGADAAERGGSMVADVAADAADRAESAVASRELPSRRDLLVGLAASLEHSGDTDAARAAYRDLAELARRTHDPYGLADAALGLHGLGFRSGSVDAGHLLLLSDAVEGLPSGARALRSRLLTALGRDLRSSADPSPGRAAAVVREAGELAVAAGDPGALAGALLAQHDIAWRPGGAKERLAILAGMADAAERARDPDLAAQTVLLRATALIELGDPDGTAQLHAFTRLADRLGHARGRWGALSRRATLAVVSGPPSDAVPLADEAFELGLLIGQPDAAAVYGTLRLSLGLVVPLAGPVPDLDPSDPVAPLLPLLRAATMLAGGAEDRARAEFRGFALSTLPEQYHLEMRALTAAVAASVGSAEQREQAHALLADYAGTHVVVGGCASYSGAVDHHLGLLCAALGRHEEAVAHLEAAVTQYRLLGAPAWAQRAREQLADATRGCVFHRDGRVWTLGYEGRQVHLPHTKGLADLAALLAAPGKDVPALELLGQPATGADPVLDDAARRAYRARITRLDAAIADAADEAEAERHQAERAELVRQITAAAGLGGRPRRLGDDAERARKAVTARIRDAIEQILRAHPPLGLHLRATVHTGTYCAYRPPGDLRWRL